MSSEDALNEIIEDSEVLEDSQDWIWIVVGLIILILIFVIFFIFYLYRKKKINEQEATKQ